MHQNLRSIGEWGAVVPQPAITSKVAALPMSEELKLQE
jgi:hypothetical protein